MKLANLSKIQADIKSEAKSNPSIADLAGYLLPIMMILVVGILILFVVRPRISEILNLRRQIAADNIRLASLVSKTNDLKAVNYSLLLSDLSSADKAVPSEKNVPTLIIGVERLAAESQVKIEAIQLAPGDVYRGSGQAGQSTPIEFKLSISGQYDNIKSFFSKALSALRLYKISDFILITDDSAGGLTVNLNAAAFSITDPKLGTDVAEPLPKLSVPERNTFEKVKAFADFTGLSVATSSASRANPFGGL